MKKLISLFIACMVVAGVISCDVAGEQNYEYVPGDSLLIRGPFEYATNTSFPPISSRLVDSDGTSTGPVDTVIVGDTTTFYLEAFTINKDYIWTVNGEEPFAVRRNGGFVDVIYDTEGVYEIRVEDGEYVGTVIMTAIDTAAAP